MKIGIDFNPRVEGDRIDAQIWLSQGRDGKSEHKEGKIDWDEKREENAKGERERSEKYEM